MKKSQRELLVMGTEHESNNNSSKIDDRKIWHKEVRKRFSVISVYLSHSTVVPLCSARSLTTQSYPFGAASMIILL